jgi:hypothetical protein
VDLDGDGNLDVLSGSWPGPIYSFAGEGGGRYAQAETLKDKSGKVIKAGKASAAWAADWDRDGDLDLLVGDVEGEVWKEVPPPGLNEEQEAERDRLQAEPEELSEQYRKAYERLATAAREKLGVDPARGLSDDDKEKLDGELSRAAEADADFKKVQEEYSEFWKRLQPLVGSHETHGRVWVFLRARRVD